MISTVVALVLLAAILHAAWNAMLRSGADRLWSVTVMGLATTVISIPFLLLLPLPAAASWPYLLLSALLQVCYSYFLARAYRDGELGQVYPIARGSAPLLVTLGAALVADEELTRSAMAGIVLVSAGIMLMARAGAAAKSGAIAAALATGFFIASYALTDGVGARLSGNPLAYSAWLFLLYGVFMLALFLVLRRKLSIRLRSLETRKAMLAGVVSYSTYAIVIWAVTLAPIGPVSALRETSIAFAAVIGHVFLGEKLTLRRLCACAIIALGAVCLGYRQ